MGAIPLRSELSVAATCARQTDRLPATQCMLAALLSAHRGSCFRLPTQRQRTMSGLVQCLLGMGNPLLDVMSNVDQAFIDKYKVTCNQEAERRTTVLEAVHALFLERTGWRSTVAFCNLALVAPCVAALVDRRQIIVVANMHLMCANWLAAAQAGQPDPS